MIYTIENHMDRELCAILMNYYEESLEEQERFVDVPRFNQITLQPNKTLIDVTRSAVDLYIKGYGSGYFNHIHDRSQSLKIFVSRSIPTTRVTGLICT